MSSERSSGGNSVRVEIPDAVRTLVLQSPVSMWIADPEGTLVFENDTNRKRFGVDSDDDVVGKYNIFRDEEIVISGLTPQIRQVFTKGGCTEFVVDYQSCGVKCDANVHPHEVLRVLLYAVLGSSGEVEYVVVQNEDYTDEWRRQSALTRSESRYRELVESISDWIWTVDLQGRILYSNPVVNRVLGYHSDEITGRSILSFVAPEELEVVSDVFRRCVESGEPLIGFTNSVLHKDGTQGYIETNAEPIRDMQGNLIGYRGVTRDITKRKKIELALMKSEENFRTIFDHVPAGVIIYDRNGVVVRANAACERMFGFPLDSLVGRSIFDTIVRPEDRARREGVMARVFAGEAADNIEWEDRRADGSSVFVLTNAAPVYDSSGRISMGLSLGVDITGFKLAEQRRFDLESAKREFYRRTIQAATNGKLSICDRGEIERMAGRSIEAWVFDRGDELAAIRSTVREVVERAGMEAGRVDDFVLCVGEMTTNAFKHAGGGSASLHKISGGFLFMVSDRGPGIDALSLPDVALRRGHTTAVSLGMGYKVMIAAADRVYLATDASGTTAAIEMRLRAPEKLSEVLTLPDAW